MTTNIRMEGLAILAALEDYLQTCHPEHSEGSQPTRETLRLKSQNDKLVRWNDHTQCTITTDSEFWINVLTKWAPVWAANDWHKKGGIKNLDIVQPLFEQYQKSGAKLVWTRGHVGTALNELADTWANRARRLRLREVVRTDTINHTNDV